MKRFFFKTSIRRWHKEFAQQSTKLPYLWNFSLLQLGASWELITSKSPQSRENMHKWSADFFFLCRAKKLSSAIKQQAWEDDPGRVLQQLKGVGDTNAQKLLKSNLTFNELQTRNASQIDFLMGKQNSSFGSSLLEELSDIPLLHIEMNACGGSSSSVCSKVQVFQRLSPTTPAIIKRLYSLCFLLYVRIQYWIALAALNPSWFEINS